MEKIRHIFLTGEKRVGKSTLLRKALEAVQLNPAGFRTMPYEINGRFRGFYLHATKTVPEGYENDIPISVALKPGCPVGVTEIFDSFGAEILDLAKEDSFVLMDELGHLERNARRFQMAVKACLDSHAHVVGVLQMRDNDMIRSILDRNDTAVYTVTPENREKLLEELVDRLHLLQSDGSF